MPTAPVILVRNAVHCIVGSTVEVNILGLGFIWEDDVKHVPPLLLAALSSGTPPDDGKLLLADAAKAQEGNRSLTTAVVVVMFRAGYRCSPAGMASGTPRNVMFLGYVSLDITHIAVTLKTVLESLRSPFLERACEMPGALEH
jgi:hypothetical protein